MKSILERDEIYQSQLMPIETILVQFANKIGWQLGNYGRRPNVGIFGKVGCLDGNILVESEESDWNLLPDELFPV